MSICLKGTLLSKALTCLKLIRNIVMLSRSLIPLAILLLHHNIQILSTGQHAYQSFLVSLPGFIPFAIA